MPKLLEWIVSFVSIKNELKIMKKWDRIVLLDRLQLHLSASWIWVIGVFPQSIHRVIKIHTR